MARSDWRRPDTFHPPLEGQTRIKLSLSYDGTHYHGWQRQEGCETVQETLEKTLGRILDEEITVFGSGRTDAGVHALMQVAHFDTFSRIAPEKFKIILNTHLPKDIRIMDSSEGGPDFHSRFTTESREYWYLVKALGDMLPFDDRRVTPVKRFPDVALLNSYAECLRGTHDFTTFCSARDPSESKCRDIYVSLWESVTDPYGFPMLRYRVAGNAFLYHQVRSMVGTMLEFASKGRTPGEFRAILEMKDRSKAEKTALSDGLYLAVISYDREKYEWFEREHAGK